MAGNSKLTVVVLITVNRQTESCTHSRYYKATGNYLGGHSFTFIFKIVIFKGESYKNVI